MQQWGSGYISMRLKLLQLTGFDLGHTLGIWSLNSCMVLNRLWAVRVLLEDCNAFLVREASISIFCVFYRVFRTYYGMLVRRFRNSDIEIGKQIGEQLISSLVITHMDASLIFSISVSIHILLLTTWQQKLLNINVFCFRFTNLCTISKQRYAIGLRLSRMHWFSLGPR